MKFTASCDSTASNWRSPKGSASAAPRRTSAPGTRPPHASTKVGDGSAPVCIHADKPNFRNCYGAAVPKLGEGGVVRLENALWSGRVAAPGEDDESPQAIRKVNARVPDDPRMNNLLLTERLGMTLLWR